MAVNPVQRNYSLLRKHFLGCQDSLRPKSKSVRLRRRLLKVLINHIYSDVDNVTVTDFLQGQWEASGKQSCCIVLYSIVK